jgi:hypothetical protein
MAFQEQVEKLVERLTRLSAEGKVEWEETADEDTFQAAVSKFVVTVGKAGSNVDSDYHLRILDQAGKVIERATVSKYGPYASTLNIVNYVDPEWVRLHDLHEYARRRALHVDEALSDLLSSLEEIG